MEFETKTLGLDGTDEIIFSETFIVYDRKLTIPEFLGKKFVFIFENTEPNQDQKDIAIEWSGDESTVVFSKKFRNPLGSGTSNKISVLKTGEGRTVLLAVFGQQFGDSALHVTVNFYIK